MIWQGSATASSRATLIRLPRQVMLPASGILYQPRYGREPFSYPVTHHYRAGFSCRTLQHAEIEELQIRHDRKGIGWAICPNQWCARISKRVARPARHARLQGRVLPLHAIYRTGYAAGPGGLPGSSPGSRPRRQMPPKQPISGHPFRIARSTKKISKREMSGTAVRSVTRFSAATSERKRLSVSGDAPRLR